jgi:hypothetical protein
MGTRGSFLGSWSWSLTSISCRGKKNSWSYISTPPNTPSRRGAQLKETQGQLYLYRHDSIVRASFVIIDCTMWKRYWFWGKRNFILRIALQRPHWLYTSSKIDASETTRLKSFNEPINSHFFRDPFYGVHNFNYIVTVVRARCALQNGLVLQSMRQY